MANFEVQIDNAAFSRVGVAPRFDAGLYGELLDEVQPNHPGLEISLTPALGWGHSPIGKLGMMLIYREQMAIAGQYNPEANVMYVRCEPNLPRTNSILLHETKHFFDDINGTLAEGQKVMETTKNRVIAGVVGGGAAIAGILAATKLGSPMWGTTTVIPGLPMMHLTYWKAPHEVAARNFAKRPDIFQRYGRVISY